MTPARQLVAASLFAFSSLGATALTACAAPTVPGSTDASGDDTAGGDSEQTSKLPPKKSAGKTTTSTPAPASAPAGAADASAPPATTPTPAPAPAPAPGGAPQACMDQCAAAGPAAQYWMCSAACHDQPCDDACWNPSCGQNAQACVSALDTCAAKCGVAGGP